MFKVLLTGCLLFSGLVVAQVEVKDEPVQKASTADDYFKNRHPHREAASESSTSHRDRFLALYAGDFLTQSEYQWGTNEPSNIAKFNVGLSYKLGGFHEAADTLLRAEVTSYSLNEGHATKFSILPMFVFPDAASRFPLYFGAGAGLGIFFEQIHDQSALAFEYQLVAGVRVFDIWDSFGLMVETGIKNHIHLLNQGQFNSVFLDVGGVFTF